jgi:hypothetical protein
MIKLKEILYRKKLILILIDLILNLVKIQPLLQLILFISDIQKITIYIILKLQQQRTQLYYKEWM